MPAASCQIAINPSNIVISIGIEVIAMATTELLRFPESDLAASTEAAYDATVRADVELSGPTPTNGWRAQSPTTNSARSAFAAAFTRSDRPAFT